MGAELPPGRWLTCADIGRLEPEDIRESARFTTLRASKSVSLNPPCIPVHP